MKTGKTLLGVLCVGIGLWIFISMVFKIDLLPMRILWPIFILLPGLIFEVSYFLSRRDPGILVPGGILTVIGLLFFFETFTNWNYMRYSWPIFILAVAVGLGQLYLCSGKPAKLLIPVLILSVVGFTALAINIFNALLFEINFSMIMAAIFVIVGLVILFKK